MATKGDSMGDGIISDLESHLAGIEGIRDEVSGADFDDRPVDPSVFEGIRWGDLATDIRRAIERLSGS
jgi:hypothetical protein